MAANQTGNKVLRLGVIQGGKIIEDKTLDRRESVTVGNDGKNTVVVPMSNLPKSLTIFELKGQQYSLCFTESMDGKLSLAQSNDQLSFAALKSQGLAKKRGDQFVVPLGDNSKGKLSLGEVTLLFQFVNPPKVAAKMELPAAARGTFFNTIDRTFTAILLAFLVIEFTGAYVLSTRDLPDTPLTLDDLPDWFVKMIIPDKPKEPPKPVEKATQAVKKDEPKKDEPKKDEPKKDEPTPEKVAAHKAELSKAVASKGLLKILGSAGGPGNSAIEDALGAGGASNDIASALEGASGVGTATADDVAGKGPKGGGSGKAAGIGDLGTKGGGSVETGPKHDVKVSGRVLDSAPEVESSDIDRASLARFVKLRLHAIQSCYEKELKRNPTLKGKIVVRFTIQTNGRIGDVEIDENTMGNDQVASCIRATVRTWNTQFKPDSEVPVSYPFVFSPAS